MEFPQSAEEFLEQRRLCEEFLHQIAAPRMEGDENVPRSAALLGSHQSQIIRLERELEHERKTARRRELKADRAAAAAETERDLLKSKVDGLEAFISKLHLCTRAVERNALIRDSQGEIRKLMAAAALIPRTPGPFEPIIGDPSPPLPDVFWPDAPVTPVHETPRDAARPGPGPPPRGGLAPRCAQ
jgi:hypothetical protein